MSSDHRDAILQAATEVFARPGIKKASIDDIARRARIGKGTVYLHFDSKEALFATVIRDVWARVFQGLTSAVRQARTPEGKLRAFFRARRDQIAELARALQVSEETALELTPLAVPHVREFRERELHLLEEILAEGTSTGQFTVPEPRLFGVGLLGWLDGLAPMLLPLGGTQELRAGTEELLEAVLRGIAAHR